MAFFRWRGIDIAGKDRSGLTMARSLQELETELFSNDIALLSARESYPRGYRSIGITAKAELFRQLASLLKAGIYIDQALTIVILQTKKKSLLLPILQDVLADVEAGSPLGNALKGHPNAFDPLAIQTILAGQRGGNLSQALESLAEYYQTSLAFRKEINHALSMPIITLGFFLFIALIILTIIMPTFAWLFASFNQDLPRATQIMLMISSWMRSWGLVALALLVAIGGFFAWHYKQNNRLQQHILRCMWHAPLIGRLSQLTNIARFFESLALLVHGGIPIKIALETVQETVTHPIMKLEITRQIEAINQGNSLSNACEQRPDLFGPDVIAFIQIGQETGLLAPMLKRASESYQQNAAKILRRVTTTIQPTLMIILGSWIALMIIAVYLPIFTLSYAIA